MPTEAIIPGGYILLARKLLESELMNKPPHFLKLWVWMLSKAFWRDGYELKRGQLLTNIGEMQDVGRYKKGNQMVGRLTEDQVRSAYGYFAKTNMVSIAKPTRGMLITIINFDSYQTASNYETHTEAKTGANPTAKPTRRTLQLTRNIIKNNPTATGETHGETQSEPHSIREEEKAFKTSCASPPSKRPPSGDHQTFIAWWSYSFERTQNKPYLSTGKDFKPVKELLTAYGLKPLVIMACWFLTCQDVWLASKRDITMFKSQINRIPGPKEREHNAESYRVAGIIPPEGTMFEDWHFWQQNEEQEALAL
ncbi:MAG: hypothetical protein WAZ50_03040 [Minisyncoccia bacterium]